MSALTFGIFFLGLTAAAQCSIDPPKSYITIKQESQRLKGINVFDVLKKLNICYLKCKEKYCECCQKIKILIAKIKVCGTFDFTPSEKIVKVGLKVSGVKLLSTKVKLERHLCRSISSTIGPMEMCIDTNVLDNRGSFPVCFKIQVAYEGIPSVLLTYGCTNGNVTANEQGSGEYHSVASLKVLNGEQVSKAIQKIAAGGGKKKD